MKDNKVSSADKVYLQSYESIFNSGAIGAVAKWTHQSLERAIKPTDRYPIVLEVGAGHGQHLEYIRHDFDKYFETDLRSELLPKREFDKRIVQLKVDAEDLSAFSDQSIDRLIASCVLIHLNNPETALKEWHRVIAKTGSLDIYISPEPGWALRLARRLSTGRKIKKLVHNHPLFHYREHRYSYLYLKAIIDNEFKDFEVSYRSYPIPLLSWNLCLWKVAHIKPKEQL